MQQLLRRHCPLLFEQYCPPFWAFNAHAQTILAGEADKQELICAAYHGVKVPGTLATKGPACAWFCDQHGAASHQWLPFLSRSRYISL
jgi:hypothetical protein